MMPHSPACRCPTCRECADVTQDDRNMLAWAWETYVGANDGEAAKLRQGQNGAVGSPRFAALKAIAATRQAYEP